MYGQFPDYGDFQVYDMGVRTELIQAAEEIYADFHMPSWGTLKHHLFTAAGSTWKLLRDLKILAGSDKKDDSEQARIFGRVSEIPIANALNE